MRKPLAAVRSLGDSRMVLCAALVLIAGATTASLRGQEESTHSSTGSVVGRVTLSGKPIPPRMIIINKDVEHCGKAPREVEDLRLSSEGAIIQAVVEIQGIDPPEGTDWDWEIPEEGYVLRQKGCRFEPALLVMPAGAKLTIHNDDEVTHNVNTGQWNSMQAKGATPIEQAVSGRLPIRVTCNIHSWMEAWIYLVRSPFFAVTDEAGDYEIKHVPAGRYRMVVWHPALGRKRVRIEVASGETTREEIAIEAPN